MPGGYSHWSWRDGRIRCQTRRCFMGRVLMLTRIFSILWLALYAAASPQLTGADAACNAACCAGSPGCYPTVQMHRSCCPCSNVSAGLQIGRMSMCQTPGQCPCMASSHRPVRSLLLLASNNIELSFSSVTLPAVLVSLPVTSLTAARNVAIDHARQPQPVLRQRCALII